MGLTKAKTCAAFLAKLRVLRYSIKIYDGVIFCRPEHMGVHFEKSDTPTLTPEIVLMRSFGRAYAQYWTLFFARQTKYIPKNKWFRLKYHEKLL